MLLRILIVASLLIQLAGCAINYSVECRMPIDSPQDGLLVASVSNR